jgi:hypothetical protein
MVALYIGVSNGSTQGWLAADCRRWHCIPLADSQAGDLRSGVLEHEYNWRHFLRYGYFKPYDAAEPIIHVERMRQCKAERLRAFLERQHDDRYPASTALDRLRSRLSGGRQEETRYEESEQPGQETRVPS